MRTNPGSLTGAPSHEDVGVSFLYVAADEGEYVANADATLECRSLGSPSATGGLIAASEVRSPAGAHVSHCTVAGDFQTFFVLEGAVEVVGAEGSTFGIGAGDVATLPHAFAFTLAVAAGSRYLELSSPAGGRCPGDPAQPQPDAELEPIINRESPEAYRLGMSPTAQRQFLHYRDLQVPTAVAETVRLEIIRADSPGHSSGWHFHPMAQIVFAVEGSAVVDVAGHGSCALEPGSAVYIGAEVPHNLRDISADYRLLEAFIPGIGGTTQCEPPC